jgi:hypothetical protein
VDYKLYRLKKEIKIYWIGFTIQHYIYLNISIKQDVFLKTIDKHTKNSGVVVFDKISKSGDGDIVEIFSMLKDLSWFSSCCTSSFSSLSPSKIFFT